MKDIHKLMYCLWYIWTVVSLHKMCAYKTANIIDIISHQRSYLAIEIECLPIKINLKKKKCHFINHEILKLSQYVHSDTENYQNSVANLDFISFVS